MEEIDYVTTGPNSTWDYSLLSAQSQQYKQYFDVSNASAFAQFIFGAFASPDYQATNYAPSTAIPLDQITGVLPVNISDVNQFSKNSSSAITSVGFSIVVEGNEIPFKSDTIETRYALPLNYMDSYTSNGYSNLDMNPFFNAIWRQHRQRDSYVDGWGSIATPYGTFDALRVHHIIEESDSIYFDIQGIALWLPLPIPTSHQYEWLAVGENDPVLRITTTEILGTETPTNIEYKDNYQGLGIKEVNAVISLYPNPVTNELHIDGLSNELLFIVIAADGSQVMNGNISQEKNHVNVESLASGTYTFLMYSNNQLSTKTFVKK